MNFKIHLTRQQWVITYRPSKVDLNNSCVKIRLTIVKRQFNKKARLAIASVIEEYHKQAIA